MQAGSAPSPPGFRGNWHGGERPRVSVSINMSKEDISWAHHCVYKGKRGGCFSIEV